MRGRTVLVAHREAMVAQGLAAALAAYPWITPLASVTTASDAERYGEHVDAAALDSQLPGADRAAWRLRQNGVRVVFLHTDGLAPIEAEEALDGDEGVRVSTKDRIGSLAAALVPDGAAPRSAPVPLSARQREVLRLIARGLPGKQVAKHLGISPKTVEQHKTRIFEKLGVPNQAAAVRVALERGLERSLA